MEQSDEMFARELFETYKHAMFKIALGILHNKSDAEDVVQNTFLWIINNLEKISQIPCTKRPLYFANTIEHMCIDLLRKQKCHPTDDIDGLEIGSGVSVEENILSNIKVEQIKTALSDLSDRDYDLMYLFLFEEKSTREICEIMGISQGNINTYITRARMRFIKILKKRGIIDDDI